MRVLKDGLVSMDMAQNILVIKTVSGMAMAVAAALDAMKFHEIVGCIAGDEPNVVFPCAALADADTGRITVYYGCADTVTGMAFTTVDELLGYLKEHGM